jgi:uncharacterized protein (TIGR00251 family)
VKANRNSVTPPLPGWVRAGEKSISLSIHVQPGARRSQVVGQHGERLKVAVKAPPLDGRANAAVVELLAERLGVRASLLQVAAGQSSRDKRIELSGAALTPDEVVLKLQPG